MSWGVPSAIETSIREQRTHRTVSQDPLAATGAEAGDSGVHASFSPDATPAIPADVSELHLLLNCATT